MKRLTLLLSLLLAAGLLLAPALQAASTHKLTAEVVSVDTEAKKVTIKGEDGKEMTARVADEAASSLADLKAGDKITLTCRDNDAGQHEAVVAIEKVKTEAAAAARKPAKP